MIGLNPLYKMVLDFTTYFNDLCCCQEFLYPHKFRELRQDIACPLKSLPKVDLNERDTKLATQPYLNLIVLKFLPRCFTVLITLVGIRFLCLM